MTGTTQTKKTNNRHPRRELQVPASAQLDITRPAVWMSRVFPGITIAVSVQQIQLLFPSKHGPPPIDTSQQFLLFAAGWGVDPRIKQAYMIPFFDSETKMVKWEFGVNYQVIQHLASQSGIVLGQRIEPDPTDWPVEYPGDNFAAKIIIERRPPLKDIEYGGRVGSMAQKYGGKLSRAWAEGKVGWAHMFQAALERRGYRRAMGLGAAYTAVDYGEAEPDMGDYAEAEIVPPAAEVEERVAAETHAAEQEALGAAVNGAPEEAEPEPPAEEVEPEAPPAEAPEDTPAEKPGAEPDIAGLHTQLAAEMRRCFPGDGHAAERWLKYHYGSGISRIGQLSASQAADALSGLESVKDGALKGWTRGPGKGEKVASEGPETNGKLFDEAEK